MSLGSFPRYKVLLLHFQNHKDRERIRSINPLFSRKFASQDFIIVFEVSSLSKQ